MSPSTFWLGLNASSATVQTIDRAPISSVEKLGVRKRGWMRPNAAGSPPSVAIDSVVRAVGRIVVCVEAEAEVSTAMISSLSSGEPNTPLAERAEDVARVAGEECSCRGRPARRR